MSRPFTNQCKLFDSVIHLTRRRCRWNFEMPAIIIKSIAILSDAGLGMAMFSLGPCHHLILASPPMEQ